MNIYNFFKNKVVLVLLLFPFLEARGISAMSVYLGGIWGSISLINTILRIISIIVLLFVLIIYYKKINFLILPVYIYIFYTISRDFLNNYEISNNIKSLAYWSIFIFFMDWLIRNKMAKEFFGAVSFILFVEIIINFITIIIYPNGMYIDERGWIYNWFLGYKNLHIYDQIPYVCVAGLYYYISLGKLPLRYWISLIIIIISSILCKSSTSAFILIMMTVLMFLYYIKKKCTKFNIIILFTCFSIVALLFIGFQFNEKFADIIFAIFKKDATFTNRTAIWSKSLQIFLNNKLLGVGNGGYNLYIVNMYVTQSHDMYLDILFTGGIIGYILYTFMIIIAGIKSFKYKDKFSITILTICMIGYFTLFIFEAKRDFNLFYIVLLLFLYGEYYQECTINKKRRKIYFNK